MTLTEWTPVSYGEHAVGKYELSIEFRTKELKQKIVSKTITDEEKEELKILTA
jgi:hypothetical protein